MNQQKKTATLEQINHLLEELNQSVADQKVIKKAIQTAYDTINQPEKESQKYKQISDAIGNMDYSLQQIALKKQYHFSEQQNQLINELRELSRKSQFRSGIGIINAAAWHF